MENASKALIIAGAILLSILIIALGIFIYNQAKAAINTDTLSSTEISTFNAQFNQYEGESILGSSVKSLLEALVANAATNSGSAEKLPSVSCDGTGFTASGATGGITAVADNENYKDAINDIKAEVSNSHNYVVTMATGTAGYVDRVCIAYNSDDETASDMSSPEV